MAKIKAVKLVKSKGTCELCTKGKPTTLVLMGTEWQNVCDKCRQSGRPYLRNTPQTGKAIRVGGIVIGYEPLL